MNRLISPAIIAVFAFVLLSSGCKKDNGTTQLTGNLFGFVTLYDQYGARIYSNTNTSTLTLTTPSAANLTTSTDSTGKYIFNNLVGGQYNLSITSTGYGSITNSQFGFLGGGNIDHDVKLSAIPNFYDSILAAPVDTLNNIVLQGTFSGTDTRKRTFVVFVGSSPTVSSAPANYKIYYSGTANNNFTTFTLKIPVSDLLDAGFANGSTVYFAVYGAAASFSSTSDVEDYNTGRLQFTALSPAAATTSIVLP